MTIFLLEDSKTGVGSFTGSILPLIVMAASACIDDKDISIGVAGISKASGETLISEISVGETLVTVSANGVLVLSKTEKAINFLKIDFR